jgi:hypothetical protein
MTKTFCDKCGKEHSLANPVMDCWIKAALEVVKEVVNNDDAESSPEYALEFERIDICQPCAKVLSGKCREFIKSIIPAKEPSNG